MRKMKSRRLHRSRKTQRRVRKTQRRVRKTQRRVRKTQRGGMNGNNSNTSTGATVSGKTKNIYNAAAALTFMKKNGVMPLSNERDYLLSKPANSPLPPVIKAVPVNNSH